MPRVGDTVTCALGGPNSGATPVTGVVVNIVPHVRYGVWVFAGPQCKYNHLERRHGRWSGINDAWPDAESRKMYVMAEDELF